MNTFLEIAEQWLRENLTVPTTRIPETESLPNSTPRGHAAWSLPSGEWVSILPHCPRCASYALYRKDNIGLYECQTCGLQEIEESTARRVV